MDADKLIRFVIEKRLATSKMHSKIERISPNKDNDEKTDSCKHVSFPTTTTPFVFVSLDSMNHNVASAASPVDAAFDAEEWN